MQPTKKVNICQNHLASLYEAIQVGNLQQAVAIEHTLTKEEECVACTYLLKTTGTVKDAVSYFLQQEGFSIETKKSRTKIQHILFWVIRISTFCVIISVLTFLEFSLRQFFMGTQETGMIQKNLIDYLIIGVIGIYIFLVLDDAFFD